jgi:hypothetical protein
MRAMVHNSLLVCGHDGTVELRYYAFEGLISRQVCNLLGAKANINAQHENWCHSFRRF